MKPGKPPCWATGAKSAVGTALTAKSLVWFTMAKTWVTEVYYPRPDIAHTRSMFLVVTGRDFFSDERTDATHETRFTEPQVPIVVSDSRGVGDRYSISKETLTDPFRNVLIQRIRFNHDESLHGTVRLWLFLEPALNNRAYGNNGWAQGELLTAEQGDFALALGTSTTLSRSSCTFEGPDDAWQQLKRTGAFDDKARSAQDGNVLLAAELNTSRNGELVIALGFGDSSRAAARSVSESLSNDFERLKEAYADAWRGYRRNRVHLAGASTDRIYDSSIAVLKTHQSRQSPGGMVASLGVPWGGVRQQVLDFRYQLVWTRDAVEAASAFVAMGDLDSAKASWEFLLKTQQNDGHWPQNMWLDGTPHWSGIQMDETGLPILLADLLVRHHVIDGGGAWPAIRRAAAYLVQNGPGTEEDRWEDDGGYSPYTLSIEIAALLAAAVIADNALEHKIADYLRSVADWWNDNVEAWTFVDDHYVRLSTPKKNNAGELRRMIIAKPEHSHSPAALELVRLGLRAASDPRMLTTIEDIDRHLKSETDTGPTWHRYPNDHYGEYDDGRPFDGEGKGRGWPLLAGERAHFEIARGRFDEARKLAAIIEGQTNDCGLIPEQVWDGPDLPDRGLYSGKPAGSAMPLVWAHAEYIKLLRSLRDGAVFDMPPHTVERYQRRDTRASHAFWTANHKILSIPSGKTLRIQLPSPATVYWTHDNWKTTKPVATAPSGLGVHYCDLCTHDLSREASIGFTLYWETDRRWENRAYEIRIA